MADHEDLIARLHDLGSAPVASATASQHLTAIAAGAGRDRKWTKARVAAAFAAGLFIGGTGLASAGALPDAAQDAVSSAAAKVGVSLPHGTERYTGAECGVGTDGKPIEWRNHGQYLKSLPADQREAASASKCGKPLKSVQGEESAAKAADADDAEKAANECKQAGKGRGDGHASDKAKEKANAKAKEKAGALADTEPATKPGKPECVEEKKPEAPVAGKTSDTDDPAPADDDGDTGDPSGKPASPGKSAEDHGARDQSGRSFDDGAPEGDDGDPSGAPGSPGFDGAAPSGDDPENPYDDAEPGE